MDKKISIILIGILLIITFIVPPLSASSTEVITLKAATYHPMKHRLTTDAYGWFFKEVEKRAKGKVKFDWFAGGTLVKPAQARDALETGLVDVCTLAILWPDYYPITNMLQLPFVVDSPIHMGDVAWEMYKTIPEMKKEFAKLKIFGFFGSGMGNLLFTKQLPNTMDDMKGLKIGAYNPQAKDMIEALGGTAQMVKVPDMYLALQRGMIDGACYPMAPSRSWKLLDVASNHVILNSVSTPQLIAMRLEVWDKLPGDIQKVFEDLTPSAGSLCGHTLQNETLWVTEEVIKRGDKFNYLEGGERAKWVKAVQPLYEKYIGFLNAKGLNGREIFDQMMAIADKYRENPSSPGEWWGRTGRKTGDGFVTAESFKN